MNTILKDELLSWSREKILELSNYMPIEGNIGEEHTYTVSGDNGIYAINSFAAHYYRNDSVIETLVDSNNNDTSNDFAAQTLLYQTGLANSSIRFIQPIETEYDGRFQYTTFKAPTDKLGMSFMPDIIQNIEIDNSFSWALPWFKLYIDQVGHIISTLKTNGLLFPKRGITLATRLKDDDGYYFYNLNSFNISYDEFIDKQLTTQFENNNLANALGRDELLSYAESKWIQ